MYSNTVTYIQQSVAKYEVYASQQSGWAVLVVPQQTLKVESIFDISLNNFLMVLSSVFLKVCSTILKKGRANKHIFSLKYFSFVCNCCLRLPFDRILGCWSNKRIFSTLFLLLDSMWFGKSNSIVLHFWLLLSIKHGYNVSIGILRS